MNEMDLCSRLYQIRRTVIKMLIDRGYLVPPSLQDEDKDTFRAAHGDVPVRDDSLTIYVKKKHDPTDQIFVFFPADEKVRVKAIKVYAERMKQEGVQRAILVVQQAMTGAAKNALQELGSLVHLEIFTETELLVNITEHQLVPKHIVLTEAEKKALLQRYKLKETQLPRIQLRDPVARYYGLQRRQVVKIIRPSETAGRYVTYRLVV